MLYKMKNLCYKLLRSIEWYEVNMNELLDKQKKGAIVVDVRGEQEFKDRHINYAINIPSYKTKNEFAKKIKDKNQEIVLYCNIGVRSKDVRKKLIKLGYKNVYSLYGGIDDYI